MDVFATAVFFLAIVHSFLTGKILKVAHATAHGLGKGLLHYLGEIEAVFGLWTVVLAIGFTYYYDWHTFVEYVETQSFVEPVFIVVIMTIASSRPIIKFFELLLWKIVKVFKGSLEAWWLVILSLGSLLGSLITEPAAMAVSAYLLAEKFYALKPSNKLKYATLALLFVNISIGGALTNFASPAVLIVSEKWHWNALTVFKMFGWKSIVAVLLSTTLYFLWLKKDIAQLKTAYVVQRYKRYVQRKFVSKKELEETFDTIEQEINHKLGFTRDFVDRCNVIKEQIKKEAIEHLSQQDYEDYDVEKALNERFEKIRMDEMKRTIPGLLPLSMRPQYRDPEWDQREDKVPYWVMGAHLIFLMWTLINAHSIIMFVAGFLFYLGFYQITAHYQNRLDLKPPMMVAFFLSGLIVHGGLQGWWIGPILTGLSEIPLGLAATALTAFNDNASIVYLSSLVPDLTTPMKYAVVSGALAGGGLTLIANAPNPVGQSILKGYFERGISGGKLFLFACFPTLISVLCFSIL